jgi:selenium metabolism protein YedF
VVNAQKALAEKDADGVIVVVDNFVAVQNLEKMAKGTGCGFSYFEEGAAHFTVTITKDPSQVFKGLDNKQVEELTQKGPVVLITADSMGRGAEDLGKLLIKGFIFSLTQLSPPPEAIIFLNGGAHLTTEGANTVPDLKALQEKGAEVYTCGTCANYYKLTESLAVGSITDMMNIATILSRASSVITL